MSNQTEIIRTQLERTRQQLQLLQELDQLESEFRLIEIEYRQRLEQLTGKLAELQTLPQVCLEM